MVLSELSLATWHRRANWLPVIALLLLTAGCSNNPTQVAITQHSELSDPPRVGRMFILGLSDDYGVRARFERIAADALRRRGITAWPSSNFMSADITPSRDSVAAALQDVSADGVMVTRLVSIAVDVTEIEERTIVKSNRPALDRPLDRPLDLFSYEYTEYNEPGYLEVTGTVSLSTDLYSASSGRLLYTFDTVTTDTESEFELMDAATEALAESMAREGLLSVTGR